MVLLSQQCCSDLTAETNLNIIVDALRQFSKLETIDVDQVVSTDFRVNFEEFVRQFESKSEDEEEEETKLDGDSGSDDAQVMDEAEFIKCTLTNKASDRSKELAERLENINSGKIARNCVDPQVPGFAIRLNCEKRKLLKDQDIGY